MIYIVASERRQADTVARWLECAPTEYEYVADTRGFDGRPRGTVIFFGNWRRRPDWETLPARARACGHVLLKLEDDRYGV